jgi:alpha-tubulin suppressor-like RCC1 family protein
MEVHAIGIDLGKTLFHLVAVDANGSVVARKRCSRTQLLTYTANVRVRVIGMEAAVDRISSGALCGSRVTRCGSCLRSKSSR